MRKEKCPAWKKVCNKCVNMNQFDGKCHENGNKSTRLVRQYNRFADKCRVNQMLVAGQEVTFVIDIGASTNMLPVKYLVRQIWN